MLRHTQLLCHKSYNGKHEQHACNQCNKHVIRRRKKKKDAPLSKTVQFSPYRPAVRPLDTYESATREVPDPRWYTAGAARVRTGRSLTGGTIVLGDSRVQDFLLFCQQQIITRINSYQPASVPKHRQGGKTYISETRHGE